MIGFSKLICGTATVSEVVKTSRNLAPGLLQFSSDNRPLVVWNMTNKCNLKCQHCYLSAEEQAYSGELTTQEAKVLIDDLAKMKIPVLLFSGGEPLVRKDVFELGAYADSLGLRVVLSTNGTLITAETAQKLKKSGFIYVGVSIDGSPETHDDFRGLKGSFDKALAGIRNSLQAGIKTGIRFTLNRLNVQDLPEVLELAVRENIPRFCMYHLVYAGRGKDMVKADISHEESRQVANFLIEKTLEFHKKGINLEILTTDNHADGIFIYDYVKKNIPERAEEVKELLKMHGGCSAGSKMSNIGPLGDVYLCQFWRHKPIGNIRKKSFSQIWTDKDNKTLKEVRQMQKYLTGKCGSCHYKDLCGGCRIRAEVVQSDIWGEDPACYLTDEEIK